MRFSNYLLIFSGIILIFYFSGMVTTNPLLDLILQPETMTSGEFYSTVILTAFIGLGAIVIGYFTKDLEKAVMAPVALYMGTLLWNFFEVFARLRAYNGVLAILFLGPVLLSFFIAVLDWWRGRDD